MVQSVLEGKGSCGAAPPGTSQPPERRGRRALLDRTDISDPLEGTDWSLEGLQLLLRSQQYSLEPASLLDVFNPNLSLSEWNLTEMEASLPPFIFLHQDAATHSGSGEECNWAAPKSVQPTFQQHLPRERCHSWKCPAVPPRPSVHLWEWPHQLAWKLITLCSFWEYGFLHVLCGCPRRYPSKPEFFNGQQPVIELPRNNNSLPPIQASTGLNVKKQNWLRNPQESFFLCPFFFWVDGNGQ